MVRDQLHIILHGRGAAPIPPRGLLARVQTRATCRGPWLRHPGGRRTLFHAGLFGSVLGEKKYLSFPNTNMMPSHSGIAIHTFDPAAGCDPITFQPCSDRALANLKKYVDSFRAVYPINKPAQKSDPIATGRYPEDVYFGGNVRRAPSYISACAHTPADRIYDDSLFLFFLTNSRGTSRLSPSLSNCTVLFSHGTSSAQSR